MDKDRKEIKKLVDESRRLRERASKLGEINAELIAQIRAIEKKIERINRKLVSSG